MRSTATCICLFITIPLFSQWIFKPIAPSGNQRIDQQKEDLPPVSLPFWDDFSTAADVPGDLWEFSESIYVNSSLGIGSPTYKVATFDGIRADGQVYSENEFYPGLTDQLVSRRIDLSGPVFDNSLYLSFFWEMGGNGEAPELSGDSLRLQFLNADSVWVTVWKRQATQVTSTTAFEQSIVQVTTNYQHEDFRFKFESFGSLQGPFDTWHLDYVYMNTGRNANNLFHQDQAFSGELSSLIAPYTEMPAEHFFIDPANHAQLVSYEVFNLNTAPGGQLNLAVNGNLEIEDNAGLVVESLTFPEDGSNTLMGSKQTNTYFFDANEVGGTDGNVDDEIIISPLAPAPDSVVMLLTLFSDFEANDTITVNNSISRRFVFFDRYAYDDGTAEFAAGVRQNGTVAMEFDLETEDTLTHIDVHFPAIIPSSVNKALTFKVWKDLGDDPISTKSFTVVETGRNEFVRVALNPPVIVSDKIYIGYTQKSADFVGVGLDRSNPGANSKIYYKIDSDWQQNELLNGVLMIRAVFEAGADLVLNTKSPQPDLVWYPNPTTNHLTILSPYTSMRIWTLDGRSVMQENRTDLHDLSFLESGVYLLEVSLPDNTTQKFKLVKK
jgi:hypothetical protein